MTSSSIRSARSFMNNYEVTLLETKSAYQLDKSPNSEHVHRCFETFDEIIPMLGQYQRVMRMIRDQIYEAVYGREYTVSLEQPDKVYSTVSRPTDSSERSLAKTASIERVPHFVVLNKILGERNKRADEAEEETSQLKIVLQKAEERINELVDLNQGLEETIVSQKEEMEELNSDLIILKEENMRLAERMKMRTQAMDRETVRLDGIIDDLNAQLSVECAKVTELTRYKSCHDDVQDRFSDPSQFSTSHQKGLFSAKEQKLRKDINEGKMIEKQLLKLKNTCIEEFDQFVENQVSAEKEMLTSLKNRTHTQNDQAAEALKTEERRKRETLFVTMIENIQNELEQNKQHLSTLKADLDKLNEIKRESKSKGKVFHSVERSQSEDDEAHLLEMVKDSSSNYQFLPQEPILNKYAITAFYSCNQGKTFYELQNMQHCQSCGQKTLVCPHKATKGEKVFHMPLQCTHIKFTRPVLQSGGATITQDISEEKLAIPMSSDQLEHLSNYARLWNDLATRLDPTFNSIARFIEDNFLVSLINQFFEVMVWNDSGDLSEVVSMLETWYQFLSDRYQVDKVALSVARDILDAIARTVHSNRLVQLFADCMCGHLDPAAFRYYLALRGLVKTIKWSSMDDFICFMKIVYPFMNGDDLEQFTMSYTSFSENKMSATLISRFILYIILKQREPAILEMENKLVNQYSTISGCMTDLVFFEAIAEISPLSSEPLCHRLLAQSKADTQAKHLSISRLSQIAGFLDLHQRTAVIEMEMNEKLQIDEDYRLI